MEHQSHNHFLARLHIPAHESPGFALLRTVLIIFFVLDAILVIFLLRYRLSPQRNISQVPVNSTAKVTAAPKKSDTPILRVGAERIYQMDYEIELSAYGTARPKDLSIVTNKLAEDSIILQAAAKDGYVELTKDIFNSPAKDYKKRIETVQKAKDAVSGSENRFRGAIIAIWFYNDWLGPLGYERSKQVALEKITSVYDRVKAGILTAEQAGRLLENDASLKELDPAYKINAYYEFDVDQDTPITFDPRFEKAIRNLKKGDVTNLFTVLDKQVDPKNGPPELATDLMTKTKSPPKIEVEVAHMFAVMKERDGGKVSSFESWMEQKRKEYEVAKI